MTVLTNVCKLIVVAFSMICFLSGCATSARPYDKPYQLTKLHSSTEKNLNKSSQLDAQNKRNSSNNSFYIVKRGDTAYSISFDNNIDFQTLVKINSLNKPYKITVGQKLILNPNKSEVKTYRVVAKDTIFSLSRRFGISTNQLVKWNDIDRNYRIEVGQLLIVGKGNNQISISKTNVETTTVNNSAPAIVGKKLSINNKDVATAVKNDQNDKKIIETPKRNNVVAQSDDKVSFSNNKKIKWQWPFMGKVVAPFSVGEHGNKGIDIGGQRGSVVKSAADGKIVYAGNALRGYGNLIIINHNNDFLSAYAHNDDILVNEGQNVKQGQGIARMGDTEANSVRLHFEIRYRGESVNPLKYLPKR
jgi:lipoprotein NlpD